MKKHTAAHRRVLINICHSVTYFVNNGTNKRIPNVANANAPSMNPIFDADNPIFDP